MEAQKKGAESGGNHPHSGDPGGSAHEVSNLLQWPVSGKFLPVSGL